ncbi:hypothetical protein X743_32040 [Mesorhizobium sp. LNHC252B00]|uniref:recombinase family protein n=1 Tax=Mesorhizobium sp. LNHC252B00 TaxID=1287252 RepID=UPI0003CEFE74|nr:recombinase family protein [Mesorhizobium sp. LNHC252B00]ESY64136.1 hypothetical protein X743_32040 [Mesorhizobium sp. LNHC252B00]
MTGNDLLPATVLKRKAVVYVRQSTPGQVQNNLESQRRQYELVDVARRWGFHDVEVIDDDLGRTASGRPPWFRTTGERPVHKQSWRSALLRRIAPFRNGRDWHHLLELCGLVEARVIDLDGVYDPCRPNDRLLLGMKGSISEFELGILRTRCLTRLAPKRGGGNCASVFRSAISGIVNTVWGLILIFGYSRRSASSFRASASLAALH